LWGKPNFAVNDAIGLKIFHKFTGDPPKVPFALYEFESELDPPQVVHQTITHRGRDERRFEGIGKNQSQLFPDFSHCRNPDTRMQMAVQINLW